MSQSQRTKYKFLEHTGDAKFQAFGQSLEEAFINAAYALVSLMWDRTQIESKIKHPVTLTGHDLKQLLVSFLEEVLYLLDSKMFLLHSAEKVRIQKSPEMCALEGLFFGDAYKKRYRLFGDVKAITYNEMEICAADPFMVQVVVDV